EKAPGVKIIRRSNGGLHNYLECDIIRVLNQMSSSRQRCASELLEIVPAMMRLIRAQVRSARSPDLSITQFRTLAFLGRTNEPMLTDLSDFLGLTLPSASKLVDGLVLAGLASRQPHPTDRRRVVLTLTAAGRKRYTEAFKYAGDFLRSRLEHLDRGDLEQLFAGMRLLREAFVESPAPQRGRSQSVVA
ncbi:MAG: MarR family winged helix-turn-helix transcriptional regulator, partial [Chthoniobacteraceae bacterium]